MDKYYIELLKEAARKTLCTPFGIVVHILLLAILAVGIAILISIIRGRSGWEEGVPDFLLGGLLSGIVLAIVFCGVVLQ